jgi:predicted dehydrogenase
MKVALMGYGARGSALAKSLYELGVLSIVMDASQDACAECKDLYPDVEITHDYHRVLASDINAVAVATPAQSHFEIVADILKADKDVFIEKPMTLSVEEAKSLEKYARDKKRVLMVGHSLLFQPAVTWVKDYMESGKLGEIYSVYQERLSLGRVRTVENALWCLGVHDVAVVLYLMGKTPDRIITTGQCVLQKQIEDDVYVHMDFAHTHVHLHNSWLWPEQKSNLTIIGSKGMLIYDELTQSVSVHNKTVDEKLNVIDAGVQVAFEGHKNLVSLEMEHFLDCIKNGQEPLTSGRSAVAVIDVLEKATQQLCAVQ